MSVLDQIIDRKKHEVGRLKSFFDLPRARAQVADLPPCVSFRDAFSNRKRVPIIAEIKKRSPSRGEIAAEVNVAMRATLYKENGAVAISVLTDGESFGGSLSDLGDCKTVVDIPVLRKDFIIDESQLYQSRLAGADAILLIAAALSAEGYAQLLETTLELGMTPLSEVHNCAELKKILPFDPPVVGINNRNLHTLKTDINTTRQLMSAIPKGTLAISESGIHSLCQIDELREFGVDGFLIGTSLMTSKNPASLLREMCKL